MSSDPAKKKLMQFATPKGLSMPYVPLTHPRPPRPKAEDNNDDDMKTVGPDDDDDAMKTVEPQDENKHKRQLDDSTETVANPGRLTSPRPTGEVITIHSSPDPSTSPALNTQAETTSTTAQNVTFTDLDLDITNL